MTHSQASGAKPRTYKQWKTGLHKARFYVCSSNPSVNPTRAMRVTMIASTVNASTENLRSERTRMTRDWMDDDEEPARPPASPVERLEPAARNKPGRPKGSTRSNRKQVALRIPKRVIDFYKAAGPGWQTRMIEVLERKAERG